MRINNAKTYQRLGLVLAIIGIAIAVFVLFFRTEETKAPAPDTAEVSRHTEDESDEPSYPLIDLQPTLDDWASTQTGTASVVIYDLENDETVAELNSDSQYFTASIYKLYVAYQGYLGVADGRFAMDEAYLNGYSRGECLDEMIRSSYSPCAEKMWVELGKENIDEALSGYGLSNTSMTALYTSAADAAIILERLYDKTDLAEAHTAMYLDSLKDQPAEYRRGLPSGFTNATVYNKVGWNLQKEWHDTAIVTFENGRSYVVSVLTENVGMTNIAGLADAIETKVTEATVQ